MELDQSEASRRRFIKLTVAGLAAATIATRLTAQEQVLSEADPTAKALHYVEDATKSATRTDTTAVCSNCMHYKGTDGAASGPCAIFPGKSVTAAGWCSAWVKKP